MTLIKITVRDARPLWLNSEAVCALQELADRTRITMINAYEYVAEESIDEILK